MDAAVTQTTDLDLKLKELEKQESFLLNRLQNTQRIAHSEYQRLSQVRADSSSQFYATNT
jgi:hypothetical protein